MTVRAEGLWLRRASGGMAAFCGLFASVLTLAVVVMLVGGAISEWRGRSIDYVVGGKLANASAKFESARLESCATDKAKLCPAVGRPEMKGYISARLASVVLNAPLAALAYALFQAGACFVGLARGRALARRTVDHLVRFAVAGLVFVVLSPFAGLLAGWTAHGSRRLMDALTSDSKVLFSVGSYAASYAGVNSLLTIVYAITLTMIALVIIKATTIVEDHAQIV